MRPERKGRVAQLQFGTCQRRTVRFTADDARQAHPDAFDIQDGDWAGELPELVQRWGPKSIPADAINHQVEVLLEGDEAVGQRVAPCVQPAALVRLVGHWQSCAVHLECQSTRTCSV